MIDIQKNKMMSTECLLTSPIEAGDEIAVSVMTNVCSNIISVSGINGEVQSELNKPMNIIFLIASLSGGFISPILHDAPLLLLLTKKSFFTQELPVWVLFFLKKASWH